MKRVFVDSGGFFSALAPKDANHPAAKALFAQAASEAWRLVTTNAVVYETHALIVNRAYNGPAAALQFLASLEGGLIQVERIAEADERAAVDLLRSHRDKAYSYCDASSFVVMERLGIDSAIAFAQHFRQYGPITVLG